MYRKINGREAELGVAMLSGSRLSDDGQLGGEHDGFFNMRIQEEWWLPSFGSSATCLQNCFIYVL